MIDPYTLIGQTVALYNYRGDGLVRVVRIDGVRDIHEDLLVQSTSKTNIRRCNPLVKSQHLALCYDLSRKVIRSYYYEHFEKVKPLGFFGQLWFTLTGRPASMTKVR
jgi:hypothetical protein